MILSKNIFTTTVCLFLFASMIAKGQTALTILETGVAVKANPELRKLLFELQPTIYITQEGMNTYGGGEPIVVECTPGKIASLYEENPAFTHIKVLKVKIKSPSDLVVIQLLKLQSFDSLEYIQLIFAYDICGNKNEQCLLPKVKGIIASGGVSVTTLYQLSIPE